MKTKKTAVMLLAGFLTVSMGTAAFAGSPTLKNNTANIKATYSEETLTPEKYYVDIQWGSLEYTYNSGTTQTWDSTTLKFKEQPGKPSWSVENGADTITVTNHSNMGIMASFSYENKENGVEGQLSKTSAYLKSAEGSDVGAAPSDSTVLTLSGTLSDKTTVKTSVGTVNVTLKGGIVDHCGSVGLPGGAYVYSTDTPGIYRSVYQATETGDITFSFKVGGYSYGARSDGKLSWAPPTQAWIDVSRLPVEEGNTYEFIFDINRLTYTMTDITATP